jgi:low temperature requirement protein LtrA
MSEPDEREDAAPHRSLVQQRHLTNRGKAVPLELFFDLVFVFAITQVTSLLAADPTWTGLGRGMAVLAALWWAWVGYSWLASAVDPEEGWIRIAFFAAMAAMFVASLATTGVFNNAAVTFSVAYLVVRLLQVVVFLAVSAGDRTFRAAIISMVPSFVAGPAMLVAAAFSGGTARGVLWALALLVDFGGPLLGGSRGWRLQPSHFAERHGLIVIIALGEAIVSVGVGAGDGGVSAQLVIVAVAVIAIAAAMWWAYFDVVAIVAERKLHELEGVPRNRLARDSFSYLHLGIVAGIVLVALGAKKVTLQPTKELSEVISFALGGGAALVLVSLSAIRRRNIGRFNVQRLVAAAASAAIVIPLALEISGLIAMLALVGVLWALVVFEATTLRAARAEIRHTSH